MLRLEQRKSSQNALMSVHLFSSRCAYRSASGADIAVIEGCMGLHDGRDGISDEGSTAQVAEAPGAQRRVLEFCHFVTREFFTNDFLGFPECETP